MPGTLLSIILSADDAVRDQSIEAFCDRSPFSSLLREADELDRERHSCDNLYQRVRALFFLYALHRFYLPARPELPRAGVVPYAALELLMRRRFEEAVRLLLARRHADGPSDPLSSALAAAYRGLAFQTLADQVRRSVRGVRGNQWMFRIGHPADHPLRIHPDLLRGPEAGLPFPVLREQTPVRMDLSHSAWSDIFFLGMDYPEGARVLNVSIDLAVLGRDAQPRPPIEVCLRVIDEPVLRLVSVDLGASADITALSEVFDFARDYLGLIKAAAIAAGIVPPGLEGSEEDLQELLVLLVGPGRGLEVVSTVNDIPKGSRLAVSTNLLAALIAAMMRATGQTKSLTGPLEEAERRLVAARAILGEWIGGSGGGWQDSGGVWPGIKLIQGAEAAPGDPEFGVSRGCLLPRHTILGTGEVPPAARRALQESLILVHGGMAQNVGPILEMVTEKYLLRSSAEWDARRQALALMDEILAHLRAGDIRGLAAVTTRNFRGPLQTIIPWASNAYTETLIERMQARFGDDFWGFWMLGGMSGGGMGFMVAPHLKREAQQYLLETMGQARREFGHALPFAMEPVIYDFAINDVGTCADIRRGQAALMPSGYYALRVPRLLRADPRKLSPLQRGDLDRFGSACRALPEMSGMVETIFDKIFPHARADRADRRGLDELLGQNGFDPEQHERVRADLRQGRIGLAQNRLPPSSAVEEVRYGDVFDAAGPLDPELIRRGEEALREGAVAVVTLAAGVGSRWTQGAGTVKALHPFCKFGGRHRSFLEVHLAKSRKTSRDSGAVLPHVFTTGYMTHGPLAEHLSAAENYHYPGPVLLSPGRAVGLRLVPAVRDLRFAWEELAQQRLDEQAEKMRDSGRAALLDWARQAGEGADYTDNIPLQCVHPVGHWFEVPNLLRNGTLLRLIADNPRLRHLLVHNVDTVGTNADPGLLGLHMAGGRCLTFEVIRRRIEDRGGGLARVDGRLRIVEGLALPREADEAKLGYYNTLTTWVDVDRLLAVFGLRREDLRHETLVSAAIARLAPRLPIYVTLKDVKKRWGYGQEDVFPVCQFERLWGDMTTLPEVGCDFVAVRRERGQQLKDQAQLDGWLRDGSAAFVDSLCEW